MYGEADSASEPMPETCINRSTPASRASRATRAARYMYGMNVSWPPSIELTAFTTPRLRHGSGNGAIIIESAWIDSMPSLTSGKALQCVLDAAMRPNRKITLKQTLDDAVPR